MEWINLEIKTLAAMCPVSVDMSVWLEQIEQQILTRQSRPDPTAPALLPEQAPEQRQAAALAAAAQGRIGQKERAIYQGPSVKRAGCGQGGSVHKRKLMQDGSVRDRLGRFYCGRSDCPFCWRGRLVRTLSRATRPLLYEHADKLRLAPLWTLSIPTEKWSSLNRSLRRLHPECGRLHLHLQDGATLVICDRPIPGGVQIAPPEAVDRVLTTIEQLHPDKSTFRLLGAWSDGKKDNGWKVIHRIEECFDFELVARELANLRKNPRFVHGIAGARYMLEWRSHSVEEADQVWRELLRRCSLSARRPGEHSCHFSANTRWPESDTPPDDNPFAPCGPPEQEVFPWT